MEKFKAFLKRKDIEISLKRYGIDALGAMAQGLFCSLLIGTIINTIGTQFHIPFLTMAVATVNDTQYTVGSLASAMSGPAMAVAIGYALHCPPLVLFSLITVGFASNALGGAGGPLAVLFVAIVAAEIGKAVSKETKIDILVTPLVTIGVGVSLSAWWAPALGKAAMKVGSVIMWATDLQPFFMGILVSVTFGDEVFESLGAVDDQHLELDGSSSVAQEFGLRYDPVCICLPGNVKNKENALKWIQSVLK